MPDLFRMLELSGLSAREHFHTWQEAADLTTMAPRHHRRQSSSLPASVSGNLDRGRNTDVAPVAHFQNKGDARKYEYQGSAAFASTPFSDDSGACA
ncbi:hypothetical protein ACU4GD_36800 [Cupriavidus basilensis]